ncbi:unnamed protein product [Periconia digitata]|uniref:Uncharacterized protein n=1 Tax=Periconia digitata TaxID=1303443 RepID=A0A9W4U0I9_9PLEO|nr:unnamed protein product [Periconia digitata]
MPRSHRMHIKIWYVILACCYVILTLYLPQSLNSSFELLRQPAWPLLLQLQAIHPSRSLRETRTILRRALISGMK